MTAVANEQSPLLRATSPTNSSRLNPRAASFNFAPKRQAQPAPISYAQVAAKPAPAPAAAPAPQQVKPEPGPESVSPSPTAAAAAPDTPSTIRAPPPAPSTASTPSNSHAASLSSQPRAKSPAPSESSSASCHSCSSEGSSIASLLPTRRSFYRAHPWLQFPISALLVLGGFVGLSVWKREVRYADLFLGAGAWLASESLKDLTFSILTREAVDALTGESLRGTGLGLPTLVHAVVQEAVRLGGIICCVGLLPEVTTSYFATGSLPPPPPPRTPGHGRKPLPPLDTLFFSALWFALGWAAVEIVWRSKEFYRRMRLYDEVLLDREVGVEELEGLREEAREHASYGTMATSGNGKRRDEDADDEVDEEELLAREREEEAAEDLHVEGRVRALEREEIERQLGVPLFDIPVGVVLVWRVDSILLSVVLTLVLSLPFRTSAPTLVRFPLAPTFVAAAAAHAFISLLWEARIRYVGIPSVSYLTLVILLFATFAALAAWGALE